MCKLKVNITLKKKIISYPHRRLIQYITFNSILLKLFTQGIKFEFGPNPMRKYMCTYIQFKVVKQHIGDSLPASTGVLMVD